MAVLYLKVEIGKNGLTQDHSDICKIAQAMGHANAAIWMRKLDFDYLDDSVQRKGYSHPSKQTKEVWNEYQSSLDSTLAKAKIAYSNLLGSNHWPLICENCAMSLEDKVALIGGERFIYYGVFMAT